MKDGVEMEHTKEIKA